jgi:cell division protein FtsI/penicillin-binding protein 2
VRRRLLWLITGFAICCAALLGRLFVLMCSPPYGYHLVTSKWAQFVTTKTDLQHMMLMETDDGRGRILYNNGFAWSGTSLRKQFGPPARGVEVVVHSEVAQPQIAPAIVGNVGLPDIWPDGSRAVAEQGRTGLESTFDKALIGARPGYIGVMKDVTGEVQGSLPFRLAPLSGANIRTSIDYAWQSWADAALKRAAVSSGAVVILDVPTNQVLAMASRDVTHPEQNIAVQAAVPGSVFKIVTAAAALDSYRFGTSARFHCSGEVHIPGVNLHCWAKHGSESLLQALAQSCDVAFAHMGYDVQRAGLTEMGRRVHVEGTGLQTVDGRTVLPEAQHGVLFRHPGNDAGLLANTAIGQEDVRMTPLQAANLASTVANEGLYRDARLALTAEVGKKVLRVYTVGPGEQGMSRATALALARGMRMAVTSPTGTAHALAHASIPCAVKTGTAELTPRSVVNGWLVGFAPYNHPKIAFCVYVGHTSSPSAHEAVRHITNNLLTAYRQFHPPSVIS